MKLFYSSNKLAQLFQPIALLQISGIGLVCLHLLLILRFTGNIDQLVLSLFFWSGIILLLWQKWNILPLRSNFWSSAAGGVLLGLLLCKSTSLLPDDSEFIRFFPGIAALGFALIASGWKLWGYCREAVILLVLMLPPGVFGKVIEWSIGSKLQVLIAQIAAFIMHYGGINLIAQGDQIITAQGVVRVEYACTGIPIFILLVQLSILVIISFRLSRIEMLQLLLGAITLALALATLRVVIMASLIAQPQAFDYWHGAAGSQIFSTTGIILFALLCQQFSSVQQAQQLQQFQQHSKG